MLVHRNFLQANGYYEPSRGLACDAATPRPADRLAPGQLAHRGDQVFELERLLERLRGADLARDYGFSAWIDANPTPYLDMELGYTRSVNYDLNAVSFGVGINVGYLARRRNGY